MVQLFYNLSFLSFNYGIDIAVSSCNRYVFSYSEAGRPALQIMQNKPSTFVIANCIPYGCRNCFAAS